MCGSHPEVWNADTGQPVGFPLTRVGGAVNSVAFSPDGHRLVTGNLDGSLRLWNLDTGQPIGHYWKAHRTQPVNSVAFSPDGHRLASASPDQTVKVWNADTRQLLLTLTGNKYEMSVAFSPDGHSLASGGGDNTVRLWNADTGRPLSEPFTGLTDTVSSVAFSPDGRRLVSASWDQTLRLWPAKATPNTLCDKLITNASHKQWGDWGGTKSTTKPCARGCPSRPTDRRRCTALHYIAEA